MLKRCSIELVLGRLRIAPSYAGDATRLEIRRNRVTLGHETTWMDGNDYYHRSQLE